MSLPRQVDLKKGFWWSGWKRHHWPADLICKGFKFYGYDKQTRQLFALVEVVKGGAFTYRTLAEFKKKVKKITGWEPYRGDVHLGRLPLPSKDKVCTGYALRWTRKSEVRLKWPNRFPQLGWARIKSNAKNAALVNSYAVYEEGAFGTRTHIVRERKSALRAQSKEYWREKLGGLRCIACGFNFEKRYGDVGADFIEMHHVRGLAATKSTQKNRVRDLVPLCSNCHRITHYKRRAPFSLAALKKVLSSN